MTPISHALYALNYPVQAFWRHVSLFQENIFYPLNNLSGSERKTLDADLELGEGCLVLVDGDQMLYPISIEMIKDRKIRNIAVSGVGSSPLAAASFARLLSQAMNEPVVGIIAGQGLRDLPLEGSDGYRLHVIDALNATWRWASKYFPLTISVNAGVSPDPISPNRSRYLGNEIKTLIEILKELDTEKNLLCIGHSRGSLVIDAALEQIEDQINPALAARLHENLSIITFGALVDIPHDYQKVSQFVGQFDVLGLLNSVATPTAKWVYFAGHTVNPHALVPMLTLSPLPLPMPVARLVLQTLESWQRPRAVG